MNEIMRKIQQAGIIPVVVLNNAGDAVPLAKALCEGGLPFAEVTFRTEAAEESIRNMKKAYPEMTVGAGTILTIEQVDRAVAAGAQFIVSPGLNPKVVKYCIEKGVTVTPGCQNPSDIEQALENGLDVVKFFPAELSGGVKMIKALSGPYTTVRFLPSGGINVDNVREYLANDKVIACSGSWMVSTKLIQAGEYGKITELVRDAVSIVREVRG